MWYFDRDNILGLARWLKQEGQWDGAGGVGGECVSQVNQKSSLVRIKNVIKAKKVSLGKKSSNVLLAQGFHRIGN